LRTPRDLFLLLPLLRQYQHPLLLLLKCLLLELHLKLLSHRNEKSMKITMKVSTHSWDSLLQDTLPLSLLLNPYLLLLDNNYLLHLLPRLPHLR